METAKKDRKKEILKLCGANIKTIIFALFSMQVALFLVQFIFSASSFIINTVLFMLIAFSFVVFKDVAEEKAKRLCFTITKIAFVIFVMMIINHGFISMAEALAGSSLDKATALSRLGFLMNIAILIGSIAFFRAEGIKTTLENLYEDDVLSKLKLGSDQELKPGDVQMCIDKETKKPVIWKYKDRFVHLLVLGPTGSGKTSQTILPLINQDIQNLEAGITVLEPKGDLAEKVYAMAEHYNRKAVYFNPLLPDCPYFNPLYGEEEDVIENIATTFKMLNTESPQFFQDMNENLIRNSLKVLKRLYGNKATLIELNRLITNANGLGRKTVTAFSRLNAENEAIAKENADIASYFLNDYFNEKSKTYEHCSGVRTQVAKLISNKYLRRVLNPPNGENDVDFDRILADGGIITISTAQGKLRDLGRFLGYFIILQLQASVFRRPGNENTRRAHFLYIDEFQVYANPGFADMLTQGRSYRVASHLATQNRALIGMGSGQEGKDFIELVSTNARNVVIYPGGNAADAKYYSEQFGEITKIDIQKGVTSDQFNPIYGFQKIGYNKVSIRKSEKKEARFSPSDIIYRPFGEITYCLIENNSIATPGVGKIQYIPKELNDKLDKMIEEYNESIFKKQGGIDDKVNLEKEIDDIDLDDTDSPEPVISKSVVESVQKERVDHRGREIVSPHEDFLDDFVIESPKRKEPSADDKESPNAIDFFGDEEDDLI